MQDFIVKEFFVYDPKSYKMAVKFENKEIFYVYLRLSN